MYPDKIPNSLNGMNLIPVTNAAEIKKFLEVPVFINKGNPEWIRPLDKDIEEVFDPQKNKLFRRKENECARWLLKDDAGGVIGRVATFVNKKYKNVGDKQKVGGIGFFECIDDQKAANFIFDFCKGWLQERGVEAMDGPINFGERDRWWGLLVEGFYEPLYCMNYNPPYYQKLFERYGFQPFFHQICYALTVHNPLMKKLHDRHAKLAADPDFHAEHLRKNELEKYAEDFCTVYNRAWAGHGGNKSLELRQAKKIFQSMRPVIDEDIVWFIYHKNKPIGCWLNLPDLNQWFKHLNGKFGLLEKLKFLWIKNTQKRKRFVGLVFGIVPEFQGIGADAYIIIEGANLIRRKMRYEEYEMQWIGDFNPKMINVAESLGTHRSRKLTTYRYLFDPNKKFERHPMLS